jgi:hypothetical protein
MRSRLGEDRRSRFLSDLRLRQESQNIGDGRRKPLSPPIAVTELTAALDLEGGRGTRWDRVRLNRLIGSIPVAPILALAGRG